MKIIFKIGLLFFSFIHIMAQNSSPFEINGKELTFYYDFYNGKYLRQMLLLPNDVDVSFQWKGSSETDLETNLQVTGDNRQSHHGSKILGGLSGMRLSFVGKEEAKTPFGTRVIIRQKDDTHALQVISFYDFYESTSTVRR